jgi:hypothetical protein
LNAFLDVSGAFVGGVEFHANPTTTLGIYVQEIPESVRTAVEALDRSCFRTEARMATKNQSIEQRFEW